MKPTLIIPCTDDKNEGKHKAIDLYTGNVYSTLKANSVSLDDFNIIIVSALHGFISASETISDYDRKMSDQDLDSYVKKHSTKAAKLLEHAEPGELYVVLPKAYQQAFDLMMTKTRFKKALSGFQSVFISRGQRGNLQQLSILKSIITKSENFEQTLFRSGIASKDEWLGYSIADQFKGYSLAYVKPEQNTPLFWYLLEDLTNGKKAFLDNGVITLVGQGKSIDATQVIEQYKALVETMSKKHSKHLSIVIPDDPFSPENSLNIVKNNAESIRWLAKRTDLILPVHKAPDIKQHAISMLKAINYASVRIGIPCKKEIKTDDGSKVDIRLSEEDIQKILFLKTKGKRPRALVKKVHFLGLSEKSRGDAYKNRLGICKAFGISMSLDANRTTAVLGNELTSQRAGSVLMREQRTGLINGKIEGDICYQRHNKIAEWDEPMLHTKALDLISEDGQAFIELWNEHNPTWDVNDDFESDESRSEYLEEMLMGYPSILEGELVEVLKKMFISAFQMPKHNPNNFEKRVSVISELFSNDRKQPTQTLLF